MSSPQKRILILNICSAKGGVGKTTLALLLGAMLSKEKVPTFLFDLDFTGTNIADALEHRGLRNMATTQGKKHYLHEYLTIPPMIELKEINKKARMIQWRFVAPGNLDNLTVIPSMVDDEVRPSFEPLLASEHWTKYLRSRLLRLAEFYLNQALKKYVKAAVIFDHSPGMHDICREFVTSKNSVAANLQAMMPKCDFDLKHLLVSSGDIADLEAVGRFFRDHIARIEHGGAEKDIETKRFFLILNRAMRKELDPDGVKYTKAAEKAFGEAWPDISESKGNGLFFVDYDLKYLFLHTVNSPEVIEMANLYSPKDDHDKNLWKSTCKVWIEK